MRRAYPGRSSGILRSGRAVLGIVSTTDEERAVSEGPEDRESKPSSGEGGAYLSPRLREKLGGGGEGGGGGGGDKYDDFKIPEHSYGGWILLGVALIGAGALVFWMVHNGQVKKAAEAKAARADSIAAQARADSLAFAALPKSKQRQILAQRAKAHADSLAAAAKKAGGSSPPGAGAAATAGSASATKPVAAAPESGAAATPPTPKEKGPYAVDVGDFIEEGRAKEVADALKPTAGAAVQVIPVTGDGGATYHVFVGNFKSRASAEALGAKLFSKGVVEQANVVPLPKAPEAAPADSTKPPASP